MSCPYLEKLIPANVKASDYRFFLSVFLQVQAEDWGPEQQPAMIKTDIMTQNEEIMCIKMIFTP